MNSVQLSMILNEPSSTGVLIAAVIVSLGWLWGSRDPQWHRPFSRCRLLPCEEHGRGRHRIEAFRTTGETCRY